MGPHYGRLGRGVSSATVDDTPWIARAHGREVTYQTNLVEPPEIADAIHTLAEQVVEDIRREERACQRVFLKVRFAPFFTTNRVRKLAEPTFDAEVIADTALDLLRRPRGRPADPAARGAGEMVPPEGGYVDPRTHRTGRSERQGGRHRTAATTDVQVPAARPCSAVGQRRRRPIAQAVSSWREDSWSLRSTEDTCVSTVFTEMNSSLATSLYW